MFVRLLLIVIVAMSQFGCKIEEEVGLYKPVELSAEARQGFERVKREFVQLEDIKIGDGLIAAWGRKIKADIDVRYTDGTLIYHGLAYVYAGMDGDIMIHNHLRGNGALSLQQTGIILGLNGMAVGGKRRMIVAPNLVCYQGAIGKSVFEGANPKKTCVLVVGDEDIIKVRKETLIVEAALTASCIPGLSVGPIWKREIRCRDSEVPRRDPTAPIWRFYEAPPHSP